jgi:hypothetical protein
MSIYTVQSSQDGAISVWQDYADAEAAAGEAGAMDPEAAYSVVEITEEELPDFWFYNPGLELC